MPLGDYTREAIPRLGLVDGGASVLANVVSEDDSVTRVARRVLQGEADAAFLYRTDLATSAASH
jgi:ABC-type molybdate transport system substrate-binding protein